MNHPAGTILDRAIELWQRADFAYLNPVLANPQPDEYKLARRIADEYAGHFDDDLIALLSSPSAVVVAQALTILRWMKSPALKTLPEHLLVDHRKVTVAGCLLVSQTLGEIARACVDDASD